MRTTFILLLVVLIAAPAAAQFFKGTSEFSLFAGFHMGDTFTHSAAPFDYEDMEIEDDAIYGVRWSYFFTDAVSMEVTLAGVNTRTSYFHEDFDLYYIHGNLVWQFGQGRFVPFLTTGLGATSMRYPELVEGYYWDSVDHRNDTRLSFNVGTGFKIYMTDNVGIRTDLRLLWTDTGWDTYDHYYVDYYNYSNDLTTIEISGGLFFAF